MRWLGKPALKTLFPSLTLHGAGIYLRPPRPQDWAEWAELRAESRRFLIPWEPSWPGDCLTKPAFNRRIERQSREWRQGRSYNFLTVRQADNRIIGGVSLSRVLRGVAQSGMIGYWVGEPYARKGHTTQAVSLLLDYAFGDLGLNRVEAATLPHNKASRTLLQRLNFNEEGFMRKYLRINGAFQDHVLYAMISDEWPVNTA